MSFNTSTLSLGEVVSIKGGKRLPKGTSLQTLPNSHPYIRVRDMGSRYIPSEGLEFVPDEIFPKIKRYIVEENDVIISIVRTIGLVSIIDGRFHLASQTENAAKLTGLDFFDAHYLYYYLTSHDGQQEIRKGTIGAVQPKLPLYNIEKIQVPWPKRNVRLQIVNQLAAIDDKARLNHQINQTLEKIAQALFKSWFVDFEPVKAKIAARQRWQALQPGNESTSPVCYAAEFDEPTAVGDLESYMNRAAMQAISGKTAAQLDALRAEDPERYQELYETAALFPSAMQDSELGEIPAGWETGSLCDLIDFNPRRALRKGTLAPYLDMKNVPTSGHLAEEVVQREMGSGTKFINGDTLLARITPCLENGKTAFVDFLEDGKTGWGSTEYIILRPTEVYPKSLGYFIARDEYFRSTAIQSMTGTSGRQRADAKSMSAMTWLIYPPSIVEKFDLVADSYLRLAKNHGDQSKVLASTRDTLLPKLLSGELTIPDAKAQMAEVADA